MMKRQTLKLLESNLTVEQIVKQLSEPVQEEPRKPMRESRRKKVEEEVEEDDYYEDDDEY